MIPTSRPYSKLEAAAVITADTQDGISKSYREYSRQFRWDDKTVKTFMSSGHIVNLNSALKDNNSNDLAAIDPQKSQSKISETDSANAPQPFRKRSAVEFNNNGVLQEVIPQTLRTDSANTPQPYSREILEKNNPCPSSPSKDLFNLWNESVEGTSLSKATKFSSTRQKKCTARLNERSLDEWAAIFRRIADTPFLCGQNDRGWKADFDWIISNDDNAAKVLEGKYDRATSTSRPSDNRYNEIFSGA